VKKNHFMTDVTTVETCRSSADKSQNANSSLENTRTRGMKNGFRTDILLNR
jgi:hypothetical protein